MNVISVAPSSVAANTSRAPSQSTMTATTVPSTSVSGPESSEMRVMRTMPRV